MEARIYAWVRDGQTWDRGRRIGLPHLYHIDSLAWNCDGSMLAVAAAETVYIFDVQSGEVEPVFDSGSAISSLDWCPDGRHLVVASKLCIEMVRVDGWQRSCKILASAPPTVVKFDAREGRRLAVGFQDGAVHTYVVRDPSFGHSKHRGADTATRSPTSSDIFGLLSSDSNVPRIATFEPLPRSRWIPSEWFQTSFRLRLWCEEPGEPHPTDACYEFVRPRRWFKQARPYINFVLELLSPVLSNAIARGVGLSSQGVPLLASSDLATMREFMAQIANPGPRPDKISGWGRTVDSLGDPLSLSSPTLRFLEELVEEAGANVEMGGLHKVFVRDDGSRLSRPASAIGRVLWLCPHHARRLGGYR